MPLYITPTQIAVRLLLAAVASLLLGLNRDEHGRPAGMRTTMLVTLAATLAMLQVNILLPLSGKGSGSFIGLDLMRLPLGVLSGIGFIGAGTILKRGNTAIGVTTAATLWYSTILGFLFGAGQLYLGIAATVLAAGILIGLRPVEKLVRRRHTGTLTILFAEGGPSESEVRRLIEACHCKVTGWASDFDSPTHLAQVRAEITWHAPNRDEDVHRPAGLDGLLNLPGVLSFRWQR